MNNSKEIKEWWEEKFYDFYWESGQYEGRLLGYEQYVNFISQTLAEERERIRQEIMELDYGNKYINTDKWLGSDGEKSYDLALSDVLFLLSISNKK